MTMTRGWPASGTTPSSTGCSGCSPTSRSRSPTCRRSSASSRCSPSASARAARPTCGPTWLPVAGMLLVALVFGELASHYPVAGALYQYSKYNVGRRYGWFVGWFYGIALLVTVASVDTGVVELLRGADAQLVQLELRSGEPLDDPDHHAGPAGDPDHAEHRRRQGHGPGRPVRRLRGDPRHLRHRDRARHPRLPPRPRLPVHHPGRAARQDQPARRSTSAARTSARC